jgi:hypothetical protein
MVQEGVVVVTTEGEDRSATNVAHMKALRCERMAEGFVTRDELLQETNPIKQQLDEFVRRSLV